MEEEAEDRDSDKWPVSLQTLGHEVQTEQEISDTWHTKLNFSLPSVMNTLSELHMTSCERLLLSFDGT